MNHRIQKQQFILAIRQGIDAFAIQHAASRFLREGLLPVLERIFDELSGEDEVIRLDHCVIDLGPITEAVLKSGVVDEAMYRMLKEEFRTALEHELSNRPAARNRIAEGVLQRWWYYMEQGRLPWNADGFNEEDYRRVLEQFSIDYVQITRLRDALLQGSDFLTRVAAQHNAWFLENLVTVLVSSRQEGLAESVTRAAGAHRLIETIYHEQAAIEKHPASSSGEAPQQRDLSESLRRWATTMTVFRQAPVHEKKAILWRRLLVWAAEHQDLFVRGGGVQLLVQDIPEELAEVLVTAPEFRGGEDPFLKTLRKMAERRAGKTTGRTTSPADTSPTARMTGSPDDVRPGPPMPTGPEDRTGVTDRKQAEISPGAETFQPTATRPVQTAAQPDAPSLSPAETQLPPQDAPFQREQVTEEGIYLPNAGLVLLHPFFSTLFQRLQLWDGGGFVTFEARQKAIYLLHFLASGERIAPEYALVFPKMLCGYALGMPVPGDMELSDEECDEALVLLENVVLRWDKLGNTSPDGLREAFLQRRGKLFDKGGRLSLLMESAALDILLDYLPWNIHLVKLPWLKDILYVDWR